MMKNKDSEGNIKGKKTKKMISPSPLLFSANSPALIASDLILFSALFTLLLESTAIIK